MAAEEDVISALLSGITEPDEKADGPTSGSEDATCMEGDTLSALLFGSGGTNEMADAVSPEDAAWVDSCLAIASEQLSDDNWSALIEALLDTLSAQPSSCGERSAADIHELEEVHAEHVQVKAEADTEVIHGEQHLVPVDSEGEEFASLPVQLSHEEDISSLENVFKVWDLESPYEEDELIKKLEELLLDSRLTPSTSDDPSTAANDKEINELVASLTDLSF